MTDKDKKNQNKPFLFDSKEMEKLVSYDPPIEQLRKEKKEVKKKIKEERKEVMRIATTPMQIPIPTLRQIPEQPFSSEEEILEAMISFYHISNKHYHDNGTYSYVYDGTYSFRDSYPNYFLYPAK